MQNSIYYAIIIKKKSGVKKMRRKIDWQLSDKTSVLVDLKDVFCKYEEDKFLEFIESDVTNYIDLENKKYKRLSSEYTMEIDFLNNVCAFNFPTHENCSFDCESNIDIDKDRVTIKYKIADDEKIITINMKEE